MSNFMLQPLHSLFNAEAAGETMIPITKLHDFNGHPFKVSDDTEMELLVKSIQENGVLSPIVVREDKQQPGYYEILSGHRRRRACELANVEEIPAVIKNLTDEEATILMVDSNMYREHILPSEKAFAYKMKHDAMKKQGRRTDLEDEEKMNTAADLGAANADSARTVFRYIRLTDLEPELLELVDSGRLPFMAGVTLSYMQSAHQHIVFQYYCEHQRIPDVTQAGLLKKLSQAEGVVQEDISALLKSMFESKAEERSDSVKPKKIVLQKEFIDLFPEEIQEEDEMKDIIVRLLKKWKEGELEV